MPYIETIKTFIEVAKQGQLASCQLECRSYLVETTNLQKAINKLIIQLYNEDPSRQLRLAIDEIIRNAYEHGNLELLSHEKSNLLNSESLERSLKSRENNFGHRLIVVNIEVEKLKIKIGVADEGSGFDWKKQNTEPSLESLHGRGLAIIKSAVDKLSYNDQGNICYIEKTF